MLTRIVNRSNSPAATTPGPAPAITLRDIGWLALVCLAALVVRLPFLTMPMIADEGGYAYATRGWLNRTGELYDDLWISRPQGIFYLYAVIFETLGTDTVAFRLAAWISICGTAIAVWTIARHWQPRPVAAIASLLFVVVSGSPSLEGYTANAEMFMILPSAWSIWTLIKAIETRRSANWLFLTGVLIGIATMLKPSGIVMLPVALIAVLTMRRRQEHGDWLIPSAWLMGGITVIGIPALVHGWILGWSDFVYAAVLYRLTMQSSANVALSDHLAALLGLRHNVLIQLVMIAIVAAIAHRQTLVSTFRRATLAMRLQRWPWVITPFRRAIFPPGDPVARRPLTVPDDRIGMLLRLWTLASLAGIAMGGDWWSHYFIQIVAPFSIWFAAILLAAVRSVRKRLRVVLAVAATLVILSPYWVVGLGSTEAMSNWLFSHPGYQAQDEVAEWIRDNSEPGTPIFVAFDQAAIYYLANRPPAYRHLYDQELRALPESYSDIISIIHSPERPLYIVSTRQPGPYPDESRTFWQEVGQYYELETMIDGIPVYRAREYTAPAQ